MRELWRKIVTCSVLTMLLIGSAVSVTGCKEEQSPMEQAADETGEAMEEAGDAMQDVAEDTAEAAEEAADTAEDQM